MAATSVLPRIANQVTSRVRCSSPLRRGAKDGSQRGSSAALRMLTAVPVAVEAARELHLHRKALGATSGMRLGGAAHGSSSKAVPVNRSVKLAAFERYMAKRRRAGATSLVAAQGAKSLHPATGATGGARSVGGAGMLPRSAPVFHSVKSRLGGAALGVRRAVQVVHPAAPMLGGSILKSATAQTQRGARPAGLGGASTGVVSAKSSRTAQPQLGGAARLANVASAAAGAVQRFGGAVQRAAQAASLPQASAPGMMALGGARAGRRAPAEASAAALQGGSAPRHAVESAPAVRMPMLGGSALSARTA
eukprot:jgi/Tetstr1/430257/TSEL_020085.t1